MNTGTQLSSGRVKGHTEIVEKLMTRPDIDVNKARTSDGRTALIMASQGHTEIVEKLMARPDIDVNKARQPGLAIVASQKGHTEIAEKLLARPGIDAGGDE